MKYTPFKPLTPNTGFSTISSGAQGSVTPKID
jgi:hypothetical protein